MKTKKVEKEVLQERLESVKREIEQKWKNDLYPEAVTTIHYGLEHLNSGNRQILLIHAAVRLGDLDLLTLFAQQDICAQTVREQRKEETAFCTPTMIKEVSEKLLKRAGRDIEREEGETQC